MKDLAVDIGNTRTKVGWTDPDGVWSVETFDTAGLADQLTRSALAAGPVARVAISSVVPAAVPAVRYAFRGSDASMPRFFEVSHDCRLPFDLAYQTPQTLGNDRIAAAAAGWIEYASGGGLVVVDAGTAVTYEAIDRHGTYLGGAIAPGPDLLSRVLRSGTAQLPETLDLPGERVIGRSTLEAIQSGVHWGFRESVAGMLRRFLDALGPGTVVVGTGGWAADLTRHVPAINVVDPCLVLRGARLLMELNDPAEESAGTR